MAAVHNKETKKTDERTSGMSKREDLRMDQSARQDGFEWGINGGRLCKQVGGTMMAP